MNRLLSTIIRRSSKPQLQRRLWGQLRRDIPRKQYAAVSAQSFFAFLLIWSVVTYSHLVSSFFLPTPDSVVRQLIHLFVTQDFMVDVMWSVARVSCGFAIAAAIALPLGIMAGSYRKIDAMVSPFSAFLRYMPATAFVPLLILWFGIGESQKMAVIFLGTFFYVLVLITDATASVEISLLETAYTLGASQWQTLRRVVLPAAAPEIMNSLKAMIGAAWTYLIVAELVAAQRGMGPVISHAGDRNHADIVLAGITAIGIIGIITNAAFEIVYRIAFKWRRASKAAEK